MRAAGVAPRGPWGEPLEHLRRVAVRPVRVARGHVAAAQFEARIQRLGRGGAVEVLLETLQQAVVDPAHDRRGPVEDLHHLLDAEVPVVVGVAQARGQRLLVVEAQARSEEHTSELQSLMRSSYAVFCLKKKKNINRQ